MPASRNLFETTVPASELDPVYIFVRDDEYDRGHRRYLEDLWAEYEPYADRNFLDQFQRRGHFHAKAWEMRLTVVLKRLGLPVCARVGAAGPDIRVEGQPPLWIEAITPSSTEELRMIHDLAIHGAVPVPETSILLKYTQALRAKWNQRNEHLAAGIVSPLDSHVVAISGSDLPEPSVPGMYGEPPSVAHVLYGIGPFTWQIEVGTGRIVDAGWSHRPKVRKVTGATVESDFFLSGKHAGISAVLYSPHGIQNRPQVFGREDGWDFEIFHNEFASVPLKPGLTSRGREWGVKDGELRILHDYRNWSPT